jgi:hypothetical protein
MPRKEAKKNTKSALLSKLVFQVIGDFSGETLGIFS